jgi:hypothetical protein
MLLATVQMVSRRGYLVAVTAGLPRVTRQFGPPRRAATSRSAVAQSSKCDGPIWLL